jgi:hypothetical protein
MKLRDAVLKSLERDDDNRLSRALVDDKSKYDSTSNRVVSKKDVAFMLAMALNGFNCPEIAKAMGAPYTYVMVVYHLKKYRRNALEYDMDKVRKLFGELGLSLDDVMGKIER